MYCEHCAEYLAPGFRVDLDQDLCCACAFELGLCDDDGQPVAELFGPAAGETPRIAYVDSTDGRLYYFGETLTGEHCWYSEQIYARLLGARDIAARPPVDPDGGVVMYMAVED